MGLARPLALSCSKPSWPAIFYVVIGGVLFSMIFLVAGNLFADALLYWGPIHVSAPAASAKMKQPRKLAKVAHSPRAATRPRRRRRIFLPPTIPSNQEIVSALISRRCAFIGWMPAATCISARSSIRSSCERVPSTTTKKTLPQRSHALFYQRRFLPSCSALFPPIGNLFGATGDRIYLLGTDAYGRDQLSRILYGGQVSLLAGLPRCRSHSAPRRADRHGLRATTAAGATNS